MARQHYARNGELAAQRRPAGEQQNHSDDTDADQKIRRQQHQAERLGKENEHR
jgi:hypothetical protein